MQRIISARQKLLLKFLENLNFKVNQEVQNLETTDIYSALYFLFYFSPQDHWI